METTSILNEVLGPVMRGPSSSHTAASYHFAVLARALLAERPVRAEFTFDADGSYGRVYREQGSDLAFAAGLMGWELTDERFPDALEIAAAQGLEICFATAHLPEADHPNTVRMRLVGPGEDSLEAVGRSIGGGSIEITALEGWPLLLNARSHEIVVETRPEASSEVLRLLTADGAALEAPLLDQREDLALCRVQRRAPLPTESRAELADLTGVTRTWAGRPLFFVKTGEALFGSAAEMVALAEGEGLSLGAAALRYESQLLGLSEGEVLAEMRRRFDVMRRSVHAALDDEPPPMQLLGPSAQKIYAAEAAGGLAVGGMHTRAAARALAAMHVNCGMGVVCAAPTAGSAGVLPGVVTTLHEEHGVDEAGAALALLAAGAVGVILAERATFAAEIAGCQVEIGAAGAMAAAAVVEVAGGTAAQGADAAAISFQNTMGSVCDLVQGIVEIPCHTRNAVAASSAFVCADLILGGYENPVPLDETIDAVYAVGQALPQELKVTALGGLALAPSAQALPRRR